MEDVQGTMFDDVLFGNNSGNRLDGWYGDDTLEGRGGPDILTGGEGNDIVYAAETTGAAGDLLRGGEASISSAISGKSSGVTVNLRKRLGGEGDLIGDFDEFDAFHQNASESAASRTSKARTPRTTSPAILAITPSGASMVTTPSTAMTATMC